MLTEMKGGELVVEVMKEFGVECVFGVPGGQTLSVTDAILSSNMKFVQTRHENGAACAADGWGRLTGEPGICLATTGPGATNLLTGIGGAYRDSSPLIALLFQNRLSDVGRGDAQDCNHGAIFSNLCKAYIPVRDASAIVWAMREAYRIARSGRPGPVVVDFYRDVVEEQKAYYEYVSPDSYCTQVRSIACDDAVARAAELLAKKKKICIWAGNGVNVSSAGAEIVELAAILHAPIVTTYNGIGAVDSDCRYLLGPRSRHGSYVTKAAIEEADCVVVVGSSLTAISTNRWALKLKDVVQIDVVPEQIGRHYPVSAGIVGDAKYSLEKLVGELKRIGPMKDDSFLNEMLIRYTDFRSMAGQSPCADRYATPVPPIAIHVELEKILKKNGVFVVDAGNPGAWAHYTKFPSGTTFLKPVNFGNMGFALGASIGCKIAQPDKEVIAFLGDGSLGMTLGELETIARENLKIIILLVNDNAYGNIKQEELYKMGENHYIGVDFLNVDYVKVAEAFGYHTTIIKVAHELESAFQEARKCNGPSLIEVKLDGSYSVWPEIFNKKD